MRGAALLLFAAATVGCGDSSGKDVFSSSLPPPTTATTVAPTTLSPEAAVKAAYLAYWQVVDSAVDPNDPRLEAIATDPILSFDRDAIETDRVEGVTTRSPDDPRLNAHHLDRVSISDTRAALVDCFVDGRIAVGPDGSIQNDDVVTKRTEVQLVMTDHGWKVSNVTFTQRIPGVAACAA